jgi:hypothetical protein
MQIKRFPAEPWPKPAPALALAPALAQRGKRGEQNCSPLFFEQFCLRLPRALCGEAGARPPPALAPALAKRGEHHHSVLLFEW